MSKPKLGEIIPNLASRLVHKGYKVCPTCGYRCESKEVFVKIANYTTGATFTADICPQCFVGWALATFPQMIPEQKPQPP